MSIDELIAALERLPAPIRPAVMHGYAVAACAGLPRQVALALLEAVGCQPGALDIAKVFAEADALRRGEVPESGVVMMVCMLVGRGHGCATRGCAALFKLLGGKSRCRVRRVAPYWARGAYALAGCRRAA